RAGGPWGAPGSEAGGRGARAVETTTGRASCCLRYTGGPRLCNSPSEPLDGLVRKAPGGCCSPYAGWHVAGMGNGDFRVVQTGPLVEVPIGKVHLLAKGGDISTAPRSTAAPMGDLQSISPSSSRHVRPV
ncbi:MAG: hypothetical protein ACT4O4_10325, partial [Nitrospiraceae bacterium]